MTKSRLELKTPVYASLSLAFASVGDAFLYPFLPVNHLAVGVPVVWVGVLLSINRFVRILSNGFMVHLFSKYGLRTVMISAVVLAIVSTMGYAVALDVVLWLTFRICWGLSFSAMRLGVLGYALQHSRQGIVLGISRSLQETGSMLALFIAPFLLNTFDTKFIFVLLSLSSLPALYFVLHLPREADKPSVSTSKWFLKFPSSFNAITLVSSILIDGIVVVVLGILFLHSQHNITLLMATTLVAFYLGYRRICLVVLSPIGGWLGERFGLDNAFNVSMAMVIFGMMVMISGWIATGAVIVFTFYSMHAAITPGSISKGERNSLEVVAENATWRDIGAAVGTLLGGVLIASPYLIHTLLFAIFSLLILLLIHLGTVQKVLKFLYAWK